MKALRTILMVCATAAGLMNPRALQADGSSTPPPTVVPPGGSTAVNLQGVPNPIKNLIVNFDKMRDNYLLQQHLLLVKLKNARTTEERQQIRESLGDIRQQFLGELKEFREQLRDDLQQLKGKIGPKEFERILDAAGPPASTGGRHHRQ